MARTWGIWTVGKLEILRRYLNAFASASKTSSEIVYLDLFAGRPENFDRSTGEPILGSAEIALAVRPPFTKLRFFERAGNARLLQEALAKQYPARGAEVVPGDCNATIAAVLTKLSSVRWAPTFAFIDPNGPHFHWTTLSYLADHRRNEKTKVELWMLLPVDLFVRTLRIDGRSVSIKSADQISAMYGTDEWRYIHTARVDGDLAPFEARDEYVNLMRWRLERVLGYSYTHPFQIVNVSGRPLYHMVFATDHSAGTKIMSDIYKKMAGELPAMRRGVQQLRRGKGQEETGLLQLFEPDVMASLVVEAPVPSDPYEHEPPWQPFRMGASQ
jgi:three-Cys-motif partner protein